MPRIENTGAARLDGWNVKPGTTRSKSDALVTPCSASLSPVTAVIDSGTSLTRSLRFCAVTTISSKPDPGCLPGSCASNDAERQNDVTKKRPRARDIHPPHLSYLTESSCSAS